MSLVSDLIDNFTAELRLPWRQGLSPAERVWMLVYPSSEERRIRAKLPDLALATAVAGHTWSSVDLTDAFGRWLATHDYAEAFVADPTNLTSAALEEFEEFASALVRSALLASDHSTLVAVVGTGALYPFMRASLLVEQVDADIQGRLLVLFPGRVERATNTYRLLDARDGFNYRARPITHETDSM